MQQKPKMHYALLLIHHNESIQFNLMVYAALHETICNSFYYLLLLWVRMMDGCTAGDSVCRKMFRTQRQNSKQQEGPLHAKWETAK